VSRPTIQAVELGKLALSRRLAERVSLHTGVSVNWLLANKYKIPPTCQRDPQMPFSRQVFDITRAEISNPRIGPGDRMVQYNTLSSVYCRLASMLLGAYRADKTVYFQHKLRLLLDELETEFPRANDFQGTDDQISAATELWKRLEEAAQAKVKHRQEMPARPDRD
jgi:hypothetical protein